MVVNTTQCWLEYAKKKKEKCDHTEKCLNLIKSREHERVSYVNFLLEQQLGHSKYRFKGQRAKKNIIWSKSGEQE